MDRDVFGWTRMDGMDYDGLGCTGINRDVLRWTGTIGIERDGSG